MPDHISQSRALMPERYAGLISYIGDPAATAGFNTINAGLAQSNGVYARTAEQTQPAFAKVDLDQAWGKKDTSATAEEPALTFDIAADGQSASDGGSNVLCTSRGQSKHLLYGSRGDSKLVISCHGHGNLPERVLGTIHRHATRAEVSFTLGQTVLPVQKYKRREWLPSKLTCTLPGLGDGQTKFKWIRVKDRYAADGDRYSTHELLDSSKLRYAEYRGYYVGRAFVGHVHILKASLSSEAMQEIVVACMALREVLR